MASTTCSSRASRQSPGRVLFAGRRFAGLLLALLAAAPAWGQNSPTALALSGGGTVVESAGTVTITATLDHAAGSDGVAVTLAAKAGSSATATSDYTLPQAFTITEGTKTGTASVTIVNDTANEADETIIVTTTVAGLTVTDTTITIDDDDAPGAPTALTVSAGTMKLDLSWTAPSGPVTDYEVEYKTSTAMDQAATGDGTDPSTGWVESAHSGTGTTHTITGLDAGTAYNVRVRASDADGDGAWVAGSGTPVEPTALALSGGGTVVESAGTVTITATLDHAAGSDGVAVTLAAKAGSSATATSDYTLPQAFTITEGTKTGTASVTIVNDTVNEADETIIVTTTVAGLTVTDTTITIDDDDAPGAPTALTVSAGALKLDLSWTAPSGPVSGYHVQHKKSATSGTTVTGDADTGWVQSTDAGTMHALTGLDGNVGYSVRVRAHDADGDGAWVTGSGTVLQPPTKLVLSGGRTVGEDVGAVTITATLDHDALANMSVTLTAKTGSTAGGSDYTLPQAFTIAEDAKTATASVAITDDLLDEEDETLIVTTSVSSSVAALAVTNTTITIEDNDDPPAGLSVTPGAASGGPTFAVGWTAPAQDDPRDIAVQVRAASATTWETPGGSHDLPSGVTSSGYDKSSGLTLSGLDKGTAYDVRLHYTKSNAAVSASSAAIEATAWTVPGAPTGLSVTAGETVGGRKLRLTWTAPASKGGAGAAITGYEVQHKTSTAMDQAATGDGTDPSTGWVTKAVTGTTHTLAGLVNGTSYAVRVRAKNGISPGSAWTSDTGTPLGKLTIGAAASVEEDVGTFTVTVTLDYTAGPGGVSVTLAAKAGGTAEEADYTLPQAFTVDAGKSSATATVGIVDDLLYGEEKDGETLVLTTSVTGVTVVDATVLIEDNDEPPAGLSVTPGAASGGPTLAVGWTAPAQDDPRDIAVQVRAASVATWKTPGGSHDLPSGVTASGYDKSSGLTLSGLDKGTAYDVRLHYTKSNAAVSASSDDVEATTWTVPGKPAVAASPVGANLAVSWTAPTDKGGTGAKVTGYKVRWRANAGGGFMGSWNVGGGVDAESEDGHAIFGLHPETRYEVQVRALNGIDPGSAWSTSAYATTEPQTTGIAVSRPQSVTVTPGAHQGGSVLTVRVGVPTLAAAVDPRTIGVAIQVKTAAASWPAKRGTHSLPGGAAVSGLAATVTGFKQRRSSNPDVLVPVYEGTVTISDGRVTGLETGAEYHVRAHLVDKSGSIAVPALFSTPTREVTTWDVPGRPASVVRREGADYILLEWTPPRDTGGKGAAITGYQIRECIGGVCGAPLSTLPSQSRNKSFPAANPAATEGQVRALNGIDPGSEWTSAGPTSLSLSADPAPAEGGGAVTLTAELNAGAPVAGMQVTLAVSGTATRNVDYRLSPTRLDFAKGETRATATLTIVDDGASDPGETLVIGASSRDPALEATPLALTIADNDADSLSLSADPAPAEGGGAVTLTAKLNAPAPSGGTTVTLALSGTATRDTSSGGDYRLSSPTLTIAADTTSATTTITVTDDAESDPGETILVDAVSNTPALRAPRLELTIADNDADSLSLSADPAPAEGGGATTLTAKLNAPAPSGGTTVTLTVSGTADRDIGSGGDYSLSSETIAITSGATSGTTTITVTDDDEPEAGETILVDAVSDTPALRAPRLDLAITDNDAPPTSLSLSAQPEEPTEGDTVTVTARLNAAARGSDATVTLTVSGSATRDTGSGGDYTLSPETIVIAVGEAQGTATIDVTDDSVPEPRERIVLIAASDNPVLRARALLIPITDNDGAPPPPPGGGGGGGPVGPPPPPAGPSLSALSLSAGWLAFAPETERYAVALPYGVGSLRVTPSVEEGDATVTVNGEEVESGEASAPVALVAGEETLIEVVVSAQNGTTTRTYTVTVTRGPAEVAFLPAASGALHGFVRVVNESDEAGEVRIRAFDDTGEEYGPLTLALEAGAAVQLGAHDLETGNADKGLGGSTGPGQGRWRLVFESELSLRALGYVRTRGAAGFPAAVHDAVAESRPSAESYRYEVAFFNPASNPRQASALRLVNRSASEASVTITGTDDAGDAGAEAVTLRLPAGAACTLSAGVLESGAWGGDAPGPGCGALTGALGDGTGKWRLGVDADRPLAVMSLMRSLEGHLTNLSTAPSGVERLWLLPSAANTVRSGFVRIVNESDEAGEVRIRAFDDTGEEYGPLTLALEAGAAVQFSSHDLESGNLDKGLGGSTGPGQGRWRLAFEGDPGLRVLGYVRTRGASGFPAAVHDVVAESRTEEGYRYEVAFFNPASNTNQASVLLLVNRSDAEAAEVTVTGADDAGDAGAEAVTLTLPAGVARRLWAPELESGEGEGLDGALGDGTGKWRLRVDADRPLAVMSLMRSLDGHLTNLSTAPPASR